jgi:DNA primase catalytic core, N-terminal domain
VAGLDHTSRRAGRLPGRSCRDRRALHPDPQRLAALRARAETGAAILRPQPTVRDAELIQIHAEAGRFFQVHLPGSWVPDYLASCGLAAALLPTSPWKIGYAPANWTALTDYLRQLSHCDAALLCSGLVVNGKNGQLRDHFHDRLMIPLRAEDGIDRVHRPPPQACYFADSQSCPSAVSAFARVLRFSSGNPSQNHGSSRSIRLR